jgi:hypothetical protein
MLLYYDSMMLSVPYSICVAKHFAGSPAMCDAKWLLFSSEFTPLGKLNFNLLYS